MATRKKTDGKTGAAKTAKGSKRAMMSKIREQAKKDVDSEKVNRSIRGKNTPAAIKKEKERQAKLRRARAKARKAGK